MKKPPLERELAMGITGGGKSLQWLKMADTLLPTGAEFRVIDTDAAIDFMMETQFPQLKPENGGNVHVFRVFSWQDYKEALNWITKKQTKPEIVKTWDDDLVKVFKKPYGPLDWNVVDMVDNAWKVVQTYFIEEVFDQDAGDYFLEVRRRIRERGDKTKGGEDAKNIMPEALAGMMEWPVINKLYDSWILPLVFQSKTHIYCTTKIEELSVRDKKNAELMSLFGGYGVKPTGQKHIGHQMHSIFLFIPGTDGWYIKTVKDRSGRDYFGGVSKKIRMTSFYHQYLVAKAGWDLP